MICLSSSSLIGTCVIFRFTSFTVAGSHGCEAGGSGEEVGFSTLSLTAVDISGTTEREELSYLDVCFSNTQINNTENGLVMEACSEDWWHATHFLPVTKSLDDTNYIHTYT